MFAPRMNRLGLAVAALMAGAGGASAQYPKIKSPVQMPKVNVPAPKMSIPAPRLPNVAPSAGWKDLDPTNKNGRAGQAVQGAGQAAANYDQHRLGFGKFKETHSTIGDPYPNGAGKTSSSQGEQLGKSAPGTPTGPGPKTLGQIQAEMKNKPIMTSDEISVAKPKPKPPAPQIGTQNNIILPQQPKVEPWVDITKTAIQAAGGAFQPRPQPQPWPQQGQPYPPQAQQWPQQGQPWSQQGGFVQQSGYTPQGGYAQPAPVFGRRRN